MGAALNSCKRKKPNYFYLEPQEHIIAGFKNDVPGYTQKKNSPRVCGFTCPGIPGVFTLRPANSLCFAMEKPVDCWAWFMTPEFKILEMQPLILMIDGTSWFLMLSLSLWQLLWLSVVTIMIHSPSISWFSRRLDINIVIIITMMTTVVVRIVAIISWSCSRTQPDGFRVIEVDWRPNQL